MKSYNNPIVNFTIKCPKTGNTRLALVKVARLSNGELFPLPAECHGALYEEETCQSCLAYCTSMFFHEQEPDDLFEAPVIPMLGKRW